MSGTTEIELPDTMRLEEAPAIAPPAEPIEPVEAERPKTPHQSAMELIAERYERQQLAGELATGEEIAAASPQIGDQGESEPATPSRPTHADPHQAAPHRTVTIQGQQFQVTEEQYAQLAEMGAMANVAMQQHAQSQAQQQHVPQPVQQRAPAGRVIDREQAAAIHNRLAYGGAEEGVAAVQDLADTLAARMAQEAVGVAQQTVHVAHQQQAQIAELNANLQQIGTEFPELFQHERLAQTAAIELTALRQRNALTGSRQSNLDLYREACRNVRQLFGTGSQEGGRGRGGAYAGDNDRLERKRQAPRNPSAVSRAAGLGPAPARAPSGSEIVEQMRRARFQS